MRIVAPAFGEPCGLFDQLKRLDIGTGAKDLGVVHKVEWSLDRRKVDFVQETTFPDEAAREHWRQHPAHSAIVNLLSATVDWTSALVEA